MILLAFMVGLGLFVGDLTRRPSEAAMARSDGETMRMAKNALLGYALYKTHQGHLPGYLPNPDLGTSFQEGASSGTAGATGRAVIGKLPWRSLASTPVDAASHHCLWYIVSGRFKDYPDYRPLNWDTLGTLDLVDRNGTVIGRDYAALIVAPGNAHDGQTRDTASPQVVRCGGNYDARNYLDPFNAAEAPDGVPNYFAGSNHREASDGGSQRFVVSDGEHYNDQFLPISVDDVFRTIIRVPEFANSVQALLDDAGLQSHLTDAGTTVSGPHGTDHLDCTEASSSSIRDFCENWKEMLFLAELPAASPIVVNGVPTAPCRRVLIFAGKRSSGQMRASAADKANKANYLEGMNLLAFDVPVATATSFAGKLAFDANDPSADLLRCLP